MALGTPGTASKVLETPGTTSGTPGVALGTLGTTLKRPGTGQQHWEPPEGHREPPQRPWGHQERPREHRERPQEHQEQPRGHREHQHSPVPVVLLEHREGFEGILELEETKERPRASGAVAGFSRILGFFSLFFYFPHSLCWRPRPWRRRRPWPRAPPAAAASSPWLCSTSSGGEKRTKIPRIRTKSQ